MQPLSKNNKNKVIVIESNKCQILYFLYLLKNNRTKEPPT